MRSVLPSLLELARQKKGPMPSRASDGPNGHFVITLEGMRLNIVSSNSRDWIADGWEHVSVSTTERCPTWDEMQFVKRLFFTDEETVIQFHPPEARLVNDHPYCLHMWRSPKKIELPPEVLI